MLRGMVFVDHMNFNIALSDYYFSLGKKTPNLDYNTIFRGVVSLVPNISYTKATVFAPEPDSFLMSDPYLVGYYRWIQGMKNAKYLDVVEGRYIGRPVTDVASMDITDKSTYYKVEKGTDINLAIHAITKAYNNAYDVAFVVSADTDYISLYPCSFSVPLRFFPSLLYYIGTFFSPCFRIPLLLAFLKCFTSG